MRPVHRVLGIFVVSFQIFFLLFNGVARGQTGTGSVFGEVTDPKGLAVRDAKVTLSNVDTGISRSTETDSAGRYEFLGLQPGSYKVQVEANGFKTVVQEKLELLVNTATRANYTLQIGSVSQTVQVTEIAAPLNTTDASLGNVLNNTQINSIPLEARSVVALLSLQPGATFLPVRPGADEMRSGSISGSRSDQSNITLDGVDVNDPQNQTGAYEAGIRIPAESLQEFRVTTSNYDATQGRSSAGQVAMVTKGGTSSFHGSAYWYHRNTATSTNEYFNKLSQLANGQPNKPPVLQKHVFGGTIGGPVPVWKDRMFFFFNYEGLHQFSQNAALRSIPSATFRDGIIIYKCKDTNHDGSNVDECPGNPVTGVSGTSYPVAPGFHGLSPSEFAAIDPKGIGPDLAALKYWSQYPMPNDPGRDGGRNIVGFRFAAPLKNHFNVSVARLDFKLDRTGNHSLFWRGALQQDTVNDEPQFPGRPPNREQLIRPKNSIVGYSAVLNPRLVNNFRWGWTRYSQLTAGLQNSDVSVFRFLDTFEGPLGLANGASSARQYLTNNLTDDISYTRGAHTFQMGTNVRFSRLPRFSNQFSFHRGIANGSWVPGVGRKFMPGRATCTTPGCSQVPAVSSSDAAVWADSSIDLWGLLTQGNARYNYNKDGSLVDHGTDIHRRYASNEYELYFQDVWRARSNLTFTFGVRYALYSPPWETNGLQVAPTPSLGTYYDERLRGMLAGIPSNQLPRVSFDLAGAANGRKGYYDWQWNNYAPRASFAWNPKFSNGVLGHVAGNGKLVIRGGYGIVFDRVGQALATTFDSGGAFGLSSDLLTPYASLTEATAPRWTALNVVPKVGSDGTPLLLPAPPGGFPATPAPGYFAITSAIDDTLKTPYAHMFDVVIGRELPGNLTVEAAYVGRYGKRLLTKWDLSMPMNLVDPASKMDYFTAASKLAALAEVGDPTGFSVGTPVANIPTIPYWEHLYPGMVGNPICDVQGLGAAAYNTATKGVYDMYLCAAPDYTTALEFLDQGGGLCDALASCSKFGPYAYFQDQFASLAGQSSVGWSYYDALQLTARKRISRGLQFQVNYAYSHSLDLTSDVERGGAFGSYFGGGYSEFVINSWNLRSNYGNSTYDLRHQINANWVYELPFGHNRALGRNVAGWANHIIGGWDFSGLSRWTSGFPFSVINCRSCWPTNWNLQGNASLFGAPPALGTTPNAPGLNGYPSPFAQGNGAVTAFRRDRPGEVGFRNQFRGDGFSTIDTSLRKIWSITEGTKIAFSWDVFNLTNTPKFDTGSITALPDISASFGRYTSTLATCDGSAGRCMQFGLRLSF